MKPMAAYKTLQDKPCRAISLLKLMDVKEHLSERNPEFRYVTPSLCVNAPIDRLLELKNLHFTGIITLRVEGSLIDLAHIEELFYYSFLDEKKGCLFIFYDTPLRQGDELPDTPDWYHEQYARQYLNLSGLLAHIRTQGKVTVRECKNSYLEYIDLW